MPKDELDLMAFRAKSQERIIFDSTSQNSLKLFDVALTGIVAVNDDCRVAHKDFFFTFANLAKDF